VSRTTKLGVESLDRRDVPAVYSPYIDPASHSLVISSLGPTSARVDQSGSSLVVRDEVTHAYWSFDRSAVSQIVFYGSSGDDSFTSYVPNIGVRANGYNGNDYLAVRASGTETNTLDGGGGNDTLYGDQGKDFLYGGAGNDYMLGSGGDDVMDGGDGNDTMYGGAGNDYLFGGAGSDELHGGVGQDYLDGGFDGITANTLDGGPDTDADTLVVHLENLYVGGKYFSTFPLDSITASGANDHATFYYHTVYR
jgi:Ca2+-binding RTX toxin-like protein